MEEWMDAEADVEGVVAGAEPRRLSRLKKHGQLRARLSRAAGLPATLDSDISENTDPTVTVEPQALADAGAGESAANSPHLREGVHGARTAPDATVVGEEDYWDEEDELEEYLNTRLEDAKKAARPSKSSACTAHVETEDSGEESAPEPGDDAATTAYLLRAAARGDRLGRAPEPNQERRDARLASALERVQGRLAAAVSRAPRPPEAVVPRFEAAWAEALAGQRGREMEREVRSKARGEAEEAAIEGVAEADQECRDVAVPGCSSIDPSRPAMGNSDDDDDLDIVSDDEMPEAAFKIVDVSDLEEEGVADAESNGLCSDGDEDDDYEDELAEVASDGSSMNSGSQGPASEEEDGAESNGAASLCGAREPAEPEEAVASEGTDCAREGDAARHAPSTAVILQEKVSEKGKKLQKLFMDMEAELSDEEGQAARVSDDEAEDDVDGGGDLADLIGQAEEDGAGAAARGDLHREWERAQDDQELRRVLDGLRRGFRRARKDAWADDDEGVAGPFRQRRRGEDGEDEDGGDLDMAWLERFGGEVRCAEASEDEEEGDRELLRKARMVRELEEPGTTGEGEFEDIAAGVEASAISVSQSAAQSGPSGTSPPSRKASAATLSRGFVGLRHRSFKISGANSGLTAPGRSYVFGRGDASALPEAGSAGEPGGPTNFEGIASLVRSAPPGVGGRVLSATEAGKCGAPQAQEKALISALRASLAPCAPQEDIKKAASAAALFAAAHKAR